MSNQRAFELSPEEAEYLSNLASEESSLRDVLPNRFGSNQNWRTLTLEHNEAELLRDYLTNRMARVGFDESYEPNREGAILEELIDKLFLTDEQWSAW